ncbi:ABC transporter ATP-binding protein [Paenibacillus tuaregi]|uniref:ABC transporter ATP-binding protein n=1 Tax=Paenibacillus tuaregi TaxID=1816681 RepID=UPI0008389186|nr:ABC transporter ATP-binding protein [Paenibacillus tuaregi]
MSYLFLNQVNKTFNRISVLKELDLEVNEGEMVTLLGPSGCGKSTLLRCISGLTGMDRGRIVLGGRDITGLPPKNRDVGMVFQSYALFPNMNVYDNIAFGLSMQKKSGAQVKAKVGEMLQLVDLEDKAKAYPHELSGGQQQRVSLARSLAVEPKLMLMDEPLSALDAKIRKHLRTELRQIQKRVGMTMLFVTHDQEEALTISDKVCLMNQGRIVQTGTPDEVYSRPRDEFAARFIGSYNVIAAEDLMRLTRQPLASGIYYALRPEAVTVTPERAGTSDRQQGAVEEGPSVTVTGVVLESVMLGNIIRYQIEADGVKLHADMLNASPVTKAHDGEPVQIEFELAACIPLEAGEV